MKISILIIGESHNDSISSYWLNQEIRKLTQKQPRTPMVFCYERPEGDELKTCIDSEQEILNLSTQTLKSVPELKQFQLASPDESLPYFPKHKEDAIKQMLIKTQIINPPLIPTVASVLLTHHVYGNKIQLLTTLLQTQIPFLSIDDKECRKNISPLSPLEEIKKVESERIKAMVKNIKTKAIPQLTAQQGGIVVVYLGSVHVKNLAASLLMESFSKECEMNIIPLTLISPMYAEQFSPSPNQKSRTGLRSYEGFQTFYGALEANQKLTNFRNFDEIYYGVEHMILYCTRNPEQPGHKKAVEIFEELIDAHKPSLLTKKGGEKVEETKQASPASFHAYKISANINVLLKKYKIDIPAPSRSDLEKLLRRIVANAMSVSTWQEDLECLLTESTVNINAQDPSGKTALHLAAAKNNIDVTQVLLKNKADFSIKDSAHKLASDYATDSNILKLLSRKDESLIFSGCNA